MFRGPLSIATLEVEIESTLAPPGRAGDVIRRNDALAPPDGTGDAGRFVAARDGEMPLARSMSTRRLLPERLLVGWSGSASCWPPPPESLKDCLSILQKI